MHEPLGGVVSGIAQSNRITTTQIAGDVGVGDLIRYLLTLLGLAAVTGYVRQRYFMGSPSSVGDTDPTSPVRGWPEIGQDLSFVLLGLAIAAIIAGFLGRIGPLFEAGLYAVVGSGGLWGACEAAKGFR